MSKANWKRIQIWAGATPDGDPGPNTAKAIIAKAGIGGGPADTPGDLAGKKATRAINMIVVHCSATKEGQDFDAADIDKWHRERGWNGIGYHYVVKLDGTVEKGRNINKTGSHVRGHNTRSIGICYIGGVDKDGKPKDTRTDAQKASLAALIGELKAMYGAPVQGHRDFPGVAKACPSFDAKSEYA